jgi:cyanophycinase
MKINSIASTLLLVAVACLRPITSRAEENPFGLPVPYDQYRVGSVMLHGGGQSLQNEVRHEFVRLAGGRDARILLMPSEMCQLGKDENGESLDKGESVADYERRLAQAVVYGRWVTLREERQVADFQFLYRDLKSDPKDERFFTLLEQATGIWMPALDQETLPNLFKKEASKQERFQRALREIVARGGVVGGLGGGMASLPETIIIGDAAMDEDADGWKRAELAFGLGLLSGVIADQTFASRAGRLERLTDLLRNGKRLDRLQGQPGIERRTIGLGVEAHTVLILSGNTIRALGEGRGHIFLKSNGDRTITWRTLAAGEVPLVVQTPSARSERFVRRTSSPSNVGDGLEVRRTIQNPFGLPEPADPSRWGTVVLHGGGDTEEIMDALPKLAGVPKPVMVHCPAARQSCRPAADITPQKLTQHLEETFSEWRQLQTQGRLKSLTFATTSDPADANRDEFIRPLKQADALWFCGGNQRPLAKLFVDHLRPTFFQIEVLNIVRRGGVVGGSSAGLAIMADVMIEGDDSENGGPAEATLSRGLGVLKHALAEQHFDARSGRIERLTGLLRDHKRLANFAPTCEPKKMIGLAVEEDTALIAQSNRLRVSGKKLAHIFLQASDPRVVTWHALQPGDAAILQQGDTGYVLELEDWEFRE